MNAAQQPATPTYRPAQPPAAAPSAAPLPDGTQASSGRASISRTKRATQTGTRQAIAFESSVKLTVNLLLAVVAATTIAKLVPYYQAQQQRLGNLQESVSVAERKNAELRSQFNRNFDPTQAARIMQEQSGMGYPNQKKVIWTSPPTSR